MHPWSGAPIRILVISGVCDNPELSLFQGLARAGFDMDLLCDPKERRRAELCEAGIHLQERFIRHRFDFASARFVRRMLQERDYDIIYSPFNKGLAAALLGSKGSPVKVVGYRGTLGNLSYLDPGCYVAHLHPRVSRIICNCDAVRQYLLDFGFPPERVVRIYKGHEVSWYQTEPASREEFGLPQDAFVVGCCANVRPLKGIDVLLRAAARLRADLPRLRLLIVGQTLDQRCQRLARRLGIADRVVFTGFRSDAVRVMTCCDVTTMPSRRREGVPRAIVESMSRGVPAIVTSVGGLPELVRHEQHGLVVPPGDSEALAGAIKRLYGHPETIAHWGSAAAQWIRDQFQVERYVAEHVALFQGLAAERRAEIARR